MSVEDFSAFNVLFHYCRPNMTDHLVYEVDAGGPEHQSLLMYTSKFENGQPAGQAYPFVISKEWVIENLDKILETVPEEG